MTVPIAAFFVWGIVLRASYRTVEKVFLVACLFYVSYIVTGFVSHPSGPEIRRALIVPRPQPGVRATSSCSSASSARPSRRGCSSTSRPRSSRRTSAWRTTHLSRIDTIVGCIAVTIVAGFIVVVCSTNLHAHGMPDRDGGRRGPVPRPDGGAVRELPLRLRAPERIGVRGEHPAAIDVLHDLRGARLGVGRRQDLRRGAAVLLALHRADRDRRRCRALPADLPPGRHVREPGRQRAPAARSSWSSC